MDDLKKARQIIDDCDQKLVTIFEKRLKAVLNVSDYKRKHHLPIFQPEREEDILDKIPAYLTDKNFSGELNALYQQILKISRRLQSKYLFPFNIVLIGFMGSGKTSVGKELATLLEMDWLDTDELIMKNSKMTINEIFHSYGETGFRKIEAKAIADLEDQKNTIISCGGGVILNLANLKILKQGGKLIWLKATPKTIAQRLLGNLDRPLLKNQHDKKDLEEMLKAREPLYHQASDLEINTEHQSINETALEIINKLLAFAP